MPVRSLLFLSILAVTATSRADDPPSEAPKPAAGATPVSLQPPEGASTSSKQAAEADLVVTQHTATIGGKQISYTATAGTLPLPGEDEKPKANVFFIAYTAPSGDDGDGPPRPITFCFNGGPGSSSVWLHMGMLGPKRAKLPAEPVVPPPPSVPIDNPFSLLDVTDLVFIDPVSTGYSRPGEGEKKEKFHGYKEDLESVGRFIHLYTTRFGRWGSRKFLCGESYGTLRAAALADHLQDRYNLELNGIVLVSTVLDFQTIRFDETNDLPYVLFLPSYTATAWYHHRLSDELQAKPLAEVVETARQFAFGDYATALLKEGSLPDAERQAVIERYSQLTGLSVGFVRRSALRVPMHRFGARLLRGDNRSIGRFDGRFTLPVRDAAGISTEYDASAAALFGAFTSAIYQYLRDDLNVKKDLPYEVLTDKVHPWNYSEFTNEFVESATPLAVAMAKNPHLKIFVANGYYDLATPFAAAEHTFARLLPAERRANVTMKYYEGGHMMYVHEPALEQLRTDLVEFYAAGQ